MPVKFEQNRMVQTTRILSFTKKNTVFFFLNHSWQRIDAILEEISVAEIIG